MVGPSIEMPAVAVVLDLDGTEECSRQVASAVAVLASCHASIAHGVDRYALVTGPGRTAVAVPWSDAAKYFSGLPVKSTESSAARVSRLAALVSSLICLHRRRTLERIDVVSDYARQHHYSSADWLRLAAAHEAARCAGLDLNVIPVGSGDVCPALSRVVGLRTAASSISGIHVVCPGCRRSRRLESLASMADQQHCEFC